MFSTLLMENNIVYFRDRYRCNAPAVGLIDKSVNKTCYLRRKALSFSTHVVSQGFWLVPEHKYWVPVSRSSARKAQWTDVKGKAWFLRATQTQHKRKHKTLALVKMGSTCKSAIIALFKKAVFSFPGHIGFSQCLGSRGWSFLSVLEIFSSFS